MKVQLLEEAEKEKFKPVSFKITFESKDELDNVHFQLKKLFILFELYRSLDNYLFDNSFEEK